MRVTLWVTERGTISLGAAKQTESPQNAERGGEHQTAGGATTSPESDGRVSLQSTPWLHRRGYKTPAHPLHQGDVKERQLRGAARTQTDWDGFTLASVERNCRRQRAGIAKHAHVSTHCQCSASTFVPIRARRGQRGQRGYSSTSRASQGGRPAAPICTQWCNSASCRQWCIHHRRAL